MARNLVVLPPKEGFSYEEVGAIGLLVNRLADREDVIVGKELDFPPFGNRIYIAMSKKGVWPLKSTDRYANQVVNLIRRERYRNKAFELVEVHNRPDVALRIFRCCPDLPILLVMHNNPLELYGTRKISVRRNLISPRVKLAAVSHWVGKQYTNGLGKIDINIYPNCIDIPVMSVEHQREKLILFVGRTVEDKGVDIFIQACQRTLINFPTWKAVIVGAPWFSTKSHLTKFARQVFEMARAAKIELIGYQSHDKVLQYMQRASIVCVPSRWQEPFGMVALEALACGAVVVASDRGGLPDLIGNAGIILSSLDPADWARTLHTLIENPQYRRILCNKARKRARLFDSVIAKRTLAELRTFINRTDSFP